MSDTRDPETDQPLPIKTDEVSIHDLVQIDVSKRKALGLKKYGSLLQASNGRDHLLDAYEEALDTCIYLKAELVRRETIREEIRFQYGEEVNDDENP